MAGFNNASARAFPSTRQQLLKVSSDLRSEERSKADAEHEITLKKFRKSCSATGGGDGPRMPDGKIYCVRKI